MAADETHQEMLKRRDERLGRHKEQVPEEVPPEAGPSTPRLPEDLEIVNDVSAEDEPVNDEDSESCRASSDSSSDSRIDSSDEDESIAQSVAKKQIIHEVQRGNGIIDSEASEIISRKQRTQEMDWKKDLSKAETAGVMLNASNNQSETSKAFVMNVTELMKTMPNPHEDLDPCEKLYQDFEFCF